MVFSFQNTFRTILNRFRLKISFRKDAIIWVIFGHFLAKELIFWILAKNLNFFTHFKRIVLRGFCAIVHFPTSIELCMLTRLFEFMVKNGQKQKFFETFWSKTFFQKRFFSTFGIFCGFFGHHNTYTFNHLVVLTKWENLLHLHYPHYGLLSVVPRQVKTTVRPIVGTNGHLKKQIRFK